MIDQKTPNQVKCKMWRSRLVTLKTKHAEFLDAHKLACEQKNESNMDTAFHKCAGLKKELKTMLAKLNADIMPYLTPEELQQLATLEKRFLANKNRHPGLRWKFVKKLLMKNPNYSIDPLITLELTGGEPDVIYHDAKKILFADCSKEVPAGRRNVVYDLKADNQVTTATGIKRHKGNAIDFARSYSARLMTTEEYILLQDHGHFDTASWTWLETDEGVTIDKKAYRGFYDDEENTTKIHFFETTAHQIAGGFRCALDVFIPTKEEKESIREIDSLINDTRYKIRDVLVPPNGTGNNSGNP